MSQRGILLMIAASAVVLLGVGLWWMLPDKAAAPAARTEATPGPAPEPRPAAPGAPSVSPPPRVPTPATQEPGEIKKIAIARSVVQRDDGTVTGGGTPAFTPDTVRAIKAAATPAIRRCIDESLARFPEFRAQTDVPGLVSVVFTANASRGEITVPEARVVINGFNDDELAHCAEQVYRNLRVTAASQPDARGMIESGFAMK